MKIYFAGAIGGGRENAGMFKELISFLKKIGHEVLTEHVGADEPLIYFAEKLGMSAAALTPTIIEQTDLAWLSGADCMIAEISTPSEGVAMEIQYCCDKAMLDGIMGENPIPLLCLLREGSREIISNFVKAKFEKPLVRLKVYKELEEAEQGILQFFWDFNLVDKSHNETFFDYFDKAKEVKSWITVGVGSLE